MLQRLLVGVACLSGRAAALNTPPWGFVPTHSAKCIDPQDAAHEGNTRWVYYSTPAGTAPKGGWPVWISLVTDTFPAPKDQAGVTCGKGGGGYGGVKPFTAWDTPNSSLASCFAPPPPPGVGAAVAAEGPFCSYEFRRECAAEEKEGYAKCMACYTTNKAHLTGCTSDEVQAICNGTAPSPPPFPPHHHGGNCDYDQEAGALWDQRLKQYLVANGIAVLSINPYEEDSWDAGPWWWDSGVDKPFLEKLFIEIRKGTFGTLNGDKVIMRGWSGGAQMISWLMQTLATNSSALDMTLAGGVMLSGGSYQCYNDPSDPTGTFTPAGTCKGCTEGGPSHCAGDPLCSSCDPTVKTYCQQCCPRNYTEQYYADKPAAYASHPPVFLAQTSKTDNHADLCACKNYYDTLKTHGVKATLVLMRGEDENCFCIGDPKNPDSAGSPYAHKCDANWGTDCTTMGGKNCCIDHTLGFASMVVPAATWALDLVA